MLTSPNSSEYTALADGEAVWLAPADAFDLELLQRLRGTLGDAALAKLGVYQVPVGFKLSVVIPAFNERTTIAEIIARVAASPVPNEIIVVDDASTDGTREVLEELVEMCQSHDYEWGRDRLKPGTTNLNLLDIRLIFHTQNRGKGAALRSGFAAATGDCVVVQDADLEYDPVDYPRLLHPLIDGRADVVYGSRFLGGPARTHLFWHRVGNWLLTLASNMTTNLNLTDMETGYKMFRRDVLTGIVIKQNRFGVEPELTAKFARRRLRFYEVPISYAGRDYAEGKKIGLTDALVAVWCIVRYALRD